MARKSNSRHITGAILVCVYNGHRLQPVFALMHITLLRGMADEN